MLNKKSIINIVALAAVGGLTLTGCASDTSEPADTTSPAVVNEEIVTAVEEANEAITELTAIEYSDPWVRWSENSEVVGGMTGAYAVITNNSDQAYTLLGGMMAEASKVEVHEMVMSEDGMAMQQIVGGLVIEPGETVTFEPGGNHLMIMGITKPLLAGDVVSIKLVFAEDNAPEVTLENMLVKPVEAGGEEYEGGMDMDMDMGMDMGASE